MNSNTTKKRNTPSTTFKEVDLDQPPSCLTDVLNNADLKERFRDFLKSRLAIESLLFYESIEYYARFAMKQSVRNKVGLSLINKFVRQDGPYQVNLSEKVSIVLLGTVDFAENAFDTAKAEIYELMSTNFFEKFVRHLQGVDDETDAPKLSFDTRLTQLTRTQSFEQLSNNLDLDTTTLSQKHSNNSLNHKTHNNNSFPETKKTTTTTTTTATGITNNVRSKGKKSKKNMIENDANTKSSNDISLTSETAMSKKKNDDDNSEVLEKNKSRIKASPSIQLFKKRVSKVRHFTFWNEIAKEEGLSFTELNIDKEI